MTSADISHLRLADETWDALCVRVADLPGLPPIGGWCLLVMDSNTRQIFALEALDSADAELVADAVIAAFLAPENGEPRQPLELRVADPELARALQSKLADGPTTIEIAELPAALERVTEALTMISQAGNVEPLPEAAAPAYFRAAATLYKAEPWIVVAPGHKLRLHFPATGDVQFATCLDDEAGLGLSVFASEDDFDRIFVSPEDDDADAAMNNSRSLFYASESEVAEEWREQRRRGRWAIAERAAFPLPAIVDADGEVLRATDADLWILAQAASAVATFVSQNRKRLARGEACSTRTQVVAERGKVPVEVSYTPIVDEAARALQEVAARALALPNTKPILERLRWSFYRAPAPVYAEDEDLAAEAVGRFVSWCVFASDHFALPLQHDIRRVARDIHVDSADVEALLTPRISYFDVVEQHPEHTRVRDRRTGELLSVRRRRGDAAYLPGEMICGALHDTGRGDYVMSPAAVTLSEIAARRAPPLKEKDVHVLGGAMEMLFGASANWIQEIPKKEVRKLYDDLRRALHATGDSIPTLPALQKTIADADSPSEVLQNLLEDANPWGEGETQVIGALFMRIWNFTPRTELGGRSPEQMP